MLRQYLIVLAALPAFAQPRAFTSADYARAEDFMGYNTAPLVYRAGVRPNWMENDRFWYRVTTAEGAEFILVDPAAGTRRPAFDHARVAAALSSAAGVRYDAHHLPFTEIELPADGKSVTFSAAGKAWRCDTAGDSCTALGSARASGGGRGGRGGGANQALSPDKKKTVFIRDYNLWVRNNATRQETQLTKDGVKDFGYATDNAGWSSQRPRHRPLVARFEEGRDLPAGSARRRRNVPGGYAGRASHAARVEVPAARRRRGHHHPARGDRRGRPARGPAGYASRPAPLHAVRRRGLPRREWSDVQWSPDGQNLAFISTSRDHSHEQLRVADAATGKVRDVLEESASTFYESGNGRANWKYLPATKEIIWFSERDNWGQLYLYDSETGKLKNQITTGEGNVTQLLRVDEAHRMLYFLGVGREKGRDPYFIHLYRVGFDGRNLALLTPEDANHEVSFSPRAATSRTATRGRMCRRWRCCATIPGNWPRNWRRPTSRNCWRRGGSRPSPSR